MLRARLTLEPDGAVCLTSGYDRQFVDDLKQAIPWDGRSWNPERKVWLVSSLYAPDLVLFLQQAGVQVQDDRPTVPDGGVLVAVPAMPADLKAAFDGLYLQYHAPLGGAEAMYKFLAKYAHPDTGNDHEDFQRITTAIATIRRYLDPNEPEEVSDVDDLPF